MNSAHLPMVRETRFLYQVESYQRLKNWYLMPPFLTLSMMKLVSNPGKGVAPFPTLLCCSYWKRSSQVALDYDWPTYNLFLLEVLNSIAWWILSDNIKSGFLGICELIFEKFYGTKHFWHWILPWSPRLMYLHDLQSFITWQDDIFFIYLFMFLFLWPTGKLVHPWRSYLESQIKRVYKKTRKQKTKKKNYQDQEKYQQQAGIWSVPPNITVDVPDLTLRKREGIVGWFRPTPTRLRKKEQSWFLWLTEKQKHCQIYEGLCWKTLVSLTVTILAILVGDILLHCEKDAIALETKENIFREKYMGGAGSLCQFFKFQAILLGTTLLPIFSMTVWEENEGLSCWSAPKPSSSISNGWTQTDARCSYYQPEGNLHASGIGRLITFYQHTPGRRPLNSRQSKFGIYHPVI